MKVFSKKVLFVVLVTSLIIVIDVAAENLINANSVTYTNGNTNVATVSDALNELFSSVNINDKIGLTDISSFGDGTITDAVSNFHSTLENEYLKPYVLYEYDGTSEPRNLAYNGMWNENTGFEWFRRIDMEICYQNQNVVVSFMPSIRVDNSQKHLSFSFDTLNRSDGKLRTVAGALIISGRYITYVKARLMLENGTPVELSPSDLYVTKIIGYGY